MSRYRWAVAVSNWRALVVRAVFRGWSSEDSGIDVGGVSHRLSNTTKSVLDKTNVLRDMRITSRQLRESQGRGLVATNYAN